jgi:hypothetical protein
MKIGKTCLDEKSTPLRRSPLRQCYTPGLSTGTPGAPEHSRSSVFICAISAFRRGPGYGGKGGNMTNMSWT